MVNFADVEKSLKAAWVNRYCSSDDHYWCALLDSHLEKLGCSFLFQCNYDLKFLDLEGLPLFYRSIVTVWQILHSKVSRGTLLDYGGLLAAIPKDWKNAILHGNQEHTNEPMVTQLTVGNVSAKYARLIQRRQTANYISC